MKLSKPTSPVYNFMVTTVVLVGYFLLFSVLLLTGILPILLVVGGFVFAWRCLHEILHEPPL
jgi:hypothetical protein